MIYQLNNETHWHVSSETMRALVSIVDGDLLEDKSQPLDSKWPERIMIELCNFRAALECELARLPKIDPNADLIS